MDFVQAFYDLMLYPFRQVGIISIVWYVILPFVILDFIIRLGDFHKINDFVRRGRY